MDDSGSKPETHMHCGSALMCLLCESNSVIYGQPSGNRWFFNRQTWLLIKHQMDLIGLERITDLLSVLKSTKLFPPLLIIPIIYYSNYLLLTAAFMIVFDVTLYKTIWIELHFIRMEKDHKAIVIRLWVNLCSFRPHCYWFTAKHHQNMCLGLYVSILVHQYIQVQTLDLQMWIWSQIYNIWWQQPSPCYIQGLLGKLWPFHIDVIVFWYTLGPF